VALTVLEHLTDEEPGCATLVSVKTSRKAHLVGKAKFWLSENLLIEKVGEETLVMHADSLESLRLTGEAAKIVEELQQNGRSSLPQSDAAAELLSAGILKTEQPSGLTRRSLLKSGAIGVGAGVATLALPTAAYASSVSYVEVTGVWVPRGGSGAKFLNNDYAWPDALGSSPTGTAPSALTIVSLAGLTTPYTVPLRTYDADGEDYVDWDDTTDNFDGLFAGTAVGTFSWGGVDYRMTFSPGG
jgi:hypothetical protein